MMRPLLVIRVEVRDWLFSGLGRFFAGEGVGETLSPVGAGCWLHSSGGFSAIFGASGSKWFMGWTIGVRDHFRLGGHNNFCPNFSSLPEKSNMFGQCIFVSHGGGCKASSSF